MEKHRIIYSFTVERIVLQGFFQHQKLKILLLNNLHHQQDHINLAASAVFSRVALVSLLCGSVYNQLDLSIIQVNLIAKRVQ